MSYSGLAVVRSLGRRGIKVYAVGCSPDEVGMRSRYATPIVIPNFIRSEEDAVRNLTKLARAIGKPAVLFSTGDAIVLPVIRNRDKLSQYFKCLMPSNNTAEALVSKAGLAEIISHYGLPGPRASVVHSAEGLDSAFEHVGAPALMKPVFSASWYRQAIVDRIGVRKAFVSETIDDIRSSYNRFADIDPLVILQEYIPGDDDSLYYVCGYFNANSEMEAVFAGRKVRLTPVHYGSASFVESVYDESLFEAAYNLLAPLGYRGLFGVEFKKDTRDDIFKIIEVNVRWGLWDGLAARCGIDLAYLAYARETGIPYDFNPHYRSGVKWVSLRRDIDAFLDYRKEGALALGGWLKTLLGENEPAVFALDDPRPSIDESAAIMHEKFGSIRSKLHAK
jgi:D-aspartate ligase